MSNTKTTLTFHGGADGVTGANFLIASGTAKLLVDCGLFQGCDFCEAANYEAFPYELSSVGALLVTHAHIDHIGRIPKLVHDGFKGPIISTEATKAIAGHLLRDAAELLRRDATRRGKTPLYEETDVARALSLWRGVPYRTSVELAEGFSARFLNAGHILGSAMVEISRGGRSLIVTGDVGNDASELIDGPDPLGNPTYLIMESVYGDKEHSGLDTRREELEDIIEDAAAKGGDILIPAFSTERTQDLIYEVRTLIREKRIPSLPVFIDSPLASRITESFLEHPSYFRKDIAKRIEGGENIFAFEEARFTESREESEGIANVKGPKIIIAGSGMSNGGRVLAHEKRLLPRKENTVLIVGYQSAGSLGRQLLEGVDRVEIGGETIKVAASVAAIYGYSAHRDGIGLLDMVHHAAPSLERVFVAMGEPKSALFLTQRIQDYLGTRADAPKKGEAVEIEL